MAKVLTIRCSLLDCDKSEYIAHWDTRARTERGYEPIGDGVRGLGCCGLVELGLWRRIGRGGPAAYGKSCVHVRGDSSAGVQRGGEPVTRGRIFMW